MNLPGQDGWQILTMLKEDIQVMSDFEFIERLQKHEMWNSIPVAILTARRTSKFKPTCSNDFLF